MTRRTPIIAIIAIGLMCCFDTTNSAPTGYFYEHPIRPFNPPPFSTLRSTGPYDGISIGRKVVASPRPRISIPPFSLLNPLTPLTPAQNTRLQPTPFTRAQPTPTPYTRQGQYQAQQQQLQQQRQQQQQQQQQQLQLRQQQQGLQQRQQQQQQQQQLQVRQQQQKQLPQQQGQYQRTFQQQVQGPVRTQYTYNQPQQPFPITVQQRISPQATPRPPPRLTPGPVAKLTPTPTPIPTQRLAPRPSAPAPTPRPVIPQRQQSTPPVINNLARPASIVAPTTPATPATPSVSISNPSQAGILASPEVYFIDGRQLKQYKVYEEIDNDIDQEVEPFIPPNFFLNSYHARIGPTQPLSDDFQLESRVSTRQFQPDNVQRQRAQQQQQNTVALGSGGLGFVRLPNGNVYLGSGSLGYISGLQRTQDVEEARTRTGASTPDPLHFGHGPLSDSFYFQSN